jgi:hypothetical protein
MIYLLFISLGLEATGVIVALEALLLGLFIPHMSLLAGKRRWLIPGSVVLIALGFILSAVLISGFDHEHPKANNIFYAMNADSGKAVWASFDQRPDDWTSAFLSSNVSRGSLAEYAPLSFDGFLKSEAQGIPLSPPNVTLLSDSTKNGIRTLRLQLASTRKAPLILASIEPDAGIVSAQVNGKLINTGRDQRWRIRYYGAGDEGIELALEVNSSNPVKIRAMDVSYGLPEAPGAKYGPRPENTIASPQPYSDSTLVSKSFSF